MKTMSCEGLIKMEEIKNVINIQKIINPQDVMVCHGNCVQYFAEIFLHFCSDLSMMSLQIKMYQ